MPDNLSILLNGPDSALPEPSRALANQAVVGGIAHELLEDAHEVVLAGIHGQAPHIDADRLLAKAAEGAATGLVALREELRSGAALLSTVSDYLAEPPKRSD